MNRQNLAFLFVILAALGGGLFYAQKSGEVDVAGAFDDIKKSVTNIGTVNAYTDAGVVVNAPTYEERIQKAIGAVSSEPVSERPAGLIAKAGGDVWTDAPNLVTGLDASKLKSIYDDADVKAALLGTDEAAAANAIRAKGGTFLVLHHRVAPSVDRSKRVLSRVYHHDYLELFSLVHVSNGLYTYVIRDKPVMFSPNVAAACAMYLRAKLGGGGDLAMVDRCDTSAARSRDCSGSIGRGIVGNNNFVGFGQSDCGRVNRAQRGLQKLRFVVCGNDE